MKKILVVAAHPDDEVLGCGGTISRYAQAGNQVHCAILGEGLTARHASRKQVSSKALRQLQNQAKTASAILGIAKTHFYSLPDNRFDTVAMLDIVKIIEKLKYKIQPDVVFTHYSGDLNIDHRITAQAVCTACRPLPGESVQEIYSFEIPSSTEWTMVKRFEPNVFVDISETLRKKVKALNAYSGEVRPFPHPRSAKNLEITAQSWGAKVGMNFAEPFILLRSLRSASINNLH